MRKSAVRFVKTIDYHKAIMKNVGQYRVLYKVFNEQNYNPYYKELMQELKMVSQKNADCLKVL